MTLLTNNFGGGTSGTGITTGNSGGASGNAFDSIFTGTGASLTFDSTHAAHGALSAKVTVGSTATTSLLEWTTSEGTQATIYYRCYLYFATNPGAISQPFRAQPSGSGAGVQITASGQIQLYNGGEGGIATFTNTIPVGQWFRLEGRVTGNASTGIVSASLYTPMDSTVATETQTSTGLDTTGNLTGYWFGNAGSNANAGSYWIDNIGISPTGYLGPVVTTAKPTSIVPSLVAAGVI